MIFRCVKFRLFVVLTATVSLIAAVYLVVLLVGDASDPVRRVACVDGSPDANDHASTSQPPYGAHNFRRPNRVIAEYDDELHRRLKTLVSRRATAADPQLIRLIMDMLDPPSSGVVKLSRKLLNTPQSREVDNILNKKVKKNKLAPLVFVGNAKIASK